jgi:hypothetical protein
LGQNSSKYAENKRKCINLALVKAGIPAIAGKLTSLYLAFLSFHRTHTLIYPVLCAFIYI